MLRNLGNRIGDAVNLITRREGEIYWRYIKNLAPNRLARKVKIADLKDNCNLFRFAKHPELIESVTSLIEERYKPALEYLETFDKTKAA